MLDKYRTTIFIVLTVLQAIIVGISLAFDTTLFTKIFSIAVLGYVVVITYSSMKED